MFHGKHSYLSAGIQLKQRIWCFPWLMVPFFHSIWLTSEQTFLGFGLTNGTQFPRISNSSGKNSLDIKLLQQCEKGQRLVCDNRRYFFFLWKNLGCPGTLLIPEDMDTLFLCKTKRFLALGGCVVLSHQTLEFQNKQSWEGGRYCVRFFFKTFCLTGSSISRKVNSSN